MTTQNNAAQPVPTEDKRPNQTTGEKGGVAGVDSKDLQNTNQAEPKEKAFETDSKTG